MRRAAFAALAVAALAPAAEAGTPRWRLDAPLPVPRTDIAVAVAGGRIVALGGLTADGAASARVHSFDPARNTWRRLHDLPFGLHHTTAASYRGGVYVVGGYRADGSRSRAAFVLRRGRWRALPNLPAERAAAGAAVVGRRLYVAGGVGPRGLARAALAFDLERRRWRFVPGPTPREHLGVVASGGRIFAVGGRTLGLDTNMTLLESFRPGDRCWRRLAPVPSARGGTGAAGLPGSIVSAGGEAVDGTIASVFRYDLAARRWRRLPDLPTPRHGLGVAWIRGRISVVGGGPQTGLFVSGANESLRLRAR